MSMSRRGLLKALGLGSVGLVAGGASLAPQIAKAIESENERLGREPATPVTPQRVVVRKSPHWEHPDMDRIEAVLTITGGYPNFWGRFHQGDVYAINGDQLKINYTIDSDHSNGEPLTLYRVYDVAKAVNVCGTSIQGPIVRDENAPDGHRLATVDELIPNEEESRAHYRPSYGARRDPVEERIAGLLG